MNSLSAEDVEFRRRFDAGETSPATFDHRAHLRLAYVHLATLGPVNAPSAFRDSLQRFLLRNSIDATKFHETLTQAWLQAVWYFMNRSGDTRDSDEFLERSVVLHDARVMLTHYSRETLYSDAARTQFVVPDLEPIPSGMTVNARRVT